MYKVDVIIVTDLVSIVVPVYNEERHLKSCLDSLLNQSYENLEIELNTSVRNIENPKLKAREMIIK